MIIFVDIDDTICYYDNSNDKLNYKNPSVYPKQEQRDSLKYFSSDIICRY